MYSQGNNRVKAKIKTSLVQLVERRSPKPDVVGSSPTGRGFFFEKKIGSYLVLCSYSEGSEGSMPEWLMGADCKSAGFPTLVRIQLGPKLKQKKKKTSFCSLSQLIGLELPKGMPL